MAIVTLAVAHDVHAQRQMERLNRGVIAVPAEDGHVFVSWRLLADDPEGVAFNVYRSIGGNPPLGHGDALHVSDLDPDRPGLEVFNIQERFDDAGANFRDAHTGEVLWKKASVQAGADGEGPGRGNAFNVDPRHRGAESWVAGANLTGMWNARGEQIAPVAPRSVNFAVWWDGDLLRELLDRTTIYKWNWRTQALDTLLSPDGVASNNGTKATPALSADLFGDWREEMIWRSTDGNELRIYTTTVPTDHRFVTLMHDPVYRLAIAWQNVAYNQPPHTSFYMGDDMRPPSRPHIVLPIPHHVP